MHGFEWKDQRSVEGVGFVRALRTQLTSHLPHLVTTLEAGLDDQFNRAQTSISDSTAKVAHPHHSSHIGPTICRWM